MHVSVDSMIFLRCVNLFFAGMLAGMETAVHYGLGAPPATLDERSQIELRQFLVLRLRVLIPAFFLPALLSTIALIAIDGQALGRWLHFVGLFALLLWIAVRGIRTVPVNSATLSWDPEAPPEDWRLQVESVERFHVLGVWATVAAFVCFLAATANASSMSTQAGTALNRARLSSCSGNCDLHRAG